MAYYPQYPQNYPVMPYPQGVDRLKAMEQQYPHLAAQQAPQGIKGRAVTGLEEARAAQIDFDGSVHFFPDLANGKIYTKQIGMDGLAQFRTYLIQQEAAQPESQDAKITRLEQKIAALEEKINSYEEAKTYGNQPNADNRNASKHGKSYANASSAGGH